MNTQRNWLGFTAVTLAALIAGCTRPAPPPQISTAAADAPAVEAESDTVDATESEVATSDSTTETESDSSTQDGGLEILDSVDSAGSDETATTVVSTPASDSPAEASDAVDAADLVTAGDWSMWGGTIFRNMVNATTGVSIDFAPAFDGAEAKRVVWTAKLGSQTYANPVVSGGRVYVGTNNGAKYRPQHEGDRGVVLAFDEKTGKLLWQLTREKLPDGRVKDWPEQGICSTPFVEGDRVWVVTNRAELMCLDANGMANGNDGDYQEEVDTEAQDADILWSLDMIEEFGVFPHNLATSSPVVYGDNVFVVTSNGVDEAHLEVPAPDAPCMIAVNKNTGELVWENNSPEDRILHGQWSSPTVGVVDGKGQVYFPGGDGWLYALDAESGEEVWRFDLNPKDSKWELYGKGTRNAIIATPVFIDNTVLLAVGQDPEHGEGVGHLYRIDATKTGDISPTLEDGPNPNSGQIWHYGGVDTDGSVTGEKDEWIFRRTMSTVAVTDGLVYAADLSGRLHCVDYKTGKRVWEHDLLAAIWGSPMVVDGKILLGTEEGFVRIMQTGREFKKLADIDFNSSIYSTPTIANGRIFVTDRSRLYVFDAR